jgi:hypothetical protein
MKTLPKTIRYSLLVGSFLFHLNAQEFDPNQIYIIENEFNGEVLLQYTSEPPQLGNGLGNDKWIKIHSKEENGKVYYSFTSPYGRQSQDSNNYERFAAPEHEGEQLRRAKSGPIWWEIIPHISKDGHNYGFFYFRNVATGLYMKDNTSIENSLNLRMPKRSSDGAYVTATKLDNPDDRRFLWQITPLTTTPPSTALTLPQSGWTPKANKIAILSSKEQITPPIFKVFTKDGKLLFESKAVYWGKYWDDLHFYTLNLNNKKLEKEGTFKLESNGITKTIYIKDNIYLHPMRQKGSDRFSIKEIFNPDFGFVTQWGRLVNWWPKPYEFLDSLTAWDHFDKSPYTFPDWVWRDDSDAVGNGADRHFEPYGGTATVEEVNNCYKGSWDMTDRYAHNYAFDGLVLSELSQMYHNAVNPDLKDSIYNEILYGVDGLLKRQESDGSWRQGFMDKLKWTGTNAGLGAGLASTLSIIKERDTILAEKVQKAIEKSWEYVQARANDKTTWAVKDEGVILNRYIVKANLPSQRNLWRESYLHFAINRYLNTKDETLKKLVENEIKQGTIYNSSWCKRGGGRLAGQFTAHGEWALVALLKYYKFASDDIKKDIEKIAKRYYEDNIVNNDIVGGPYGAYGKYLTKNPTAYTWQVWKKMMCATLLYATFGQEYGQGMLLTQKALDWYWGANPYESSLIFGVGDFYVNSGWASYHTIGRHIGVESSNMHLKGTDGSWVAAETTVVGSLAIWNSIILLDKYRNSLKKVEIFTDEDFKGSKVALPAGKYNDDLLKAYGINLNDISSAKVPQNFRIKFYTGKNFDGTVEEVNDDITALSSTNNKVNSIEVLYEGAIKAPKAQSSEKALNSFDEVAQTDINNSKKAQETKPKQSSQISKEDKKKENANTEFTNKNNSSKEEINKTIEEIKNTPKKENKNDSSTNNSQQDIKHTIQKTPKTNTQNISNPSQTNTLTKNSQDNKTTELKASNSFSIFGLLFGFLLVLFYKKIN